MARGVFPAGDKGGGDVFWKTALTNLLSGLDSQQRKEGKLWMHNPITLFFCQRENGLEKWGTETFLFQTSLYSKTDTPTKFFTPFPELPPLSAGSLTTESRARQLNVWRNSSSILPENSTSSGHLEWDYWRKNRILAQWKIRCTRWSLAHFPFSLHTCPAPLPHTLSAGWRSFSYRNSWRNIMSMTKSKMGSSCMWPEFPRMSAGRHRG